MLRHLINRTDINYVSDTVQKTDVELIECYLCSLQVPIDKTMEIPLTTGGNVRVHPSCMDFYMSQTANSPAACGSCTGDKGCC